MKKLLFLLIISSLSNSIFAQSQRGDITLAPTFGLNLSTFSSEATYGIKTGIHGGLIGEYYVNEEWSIRSGVLYDALGAEDDFDNVDKVNYFNVPLNAAWHFGKNYNWYLNFGLSLAFLSDAKGELNDGSEVEIKDSINNFDFGLSLGIGYKFFVSENLALFLEVQNYNGILDIINENEFPVDLRNARTAINFGAIFNL